MIDNGTLRCPTEFCSQFSSGHAIASNFDRLRPELCWSGENSSDDLANVLNCDELHRSIWLHEERELTSVETHTR